MIQNLTTHPLGLNNLTTIFFKWFTTNQMCWLKPSDFPYVTVYWRVPLSIFFFSTGYLQTHHGPCCRYQIRPNAFMRAISGVPCEGFLICWLHLKMARKSPSRLNLNTFSRLLVTACPMVYYGTRWKNENFSWLSYTQSELTAYAAWWLTTCSFTENESPVVADDEWDNHLVSLGPYIKFVGSFCSET